MSALLRYSCGFYAANLTSLVLALEQAFKHG